MGLDLFIRPRNGSTDESLADFLRRRLGQEALDKIGEPLMAGIHVADPERLSLQATFPRYAEIERRYGSLIRGMIAARRQHAAPRPGAAPGAPRPSSSGPKTTVFMTLYGGLMELVETLAARLEGATIRTGCTVTSLTAAGTEGTEGNGRDGTEPRNPASGGPGSWK